MRNAAKPGLAQIHGSGGDGGSRGIGSSAAANQNVQSPARAERGGLRRPCRAHRNLKSKWRRRAGYRQRFRVNARYWRSVGDEVHVAGLRSKVQERVFEYGKRTGVEEVDHALQPKDALQRNILGFIRVRIRFAGSLCNRQGWRDVLRVLRGGAAGENGRKIRDLSRRSGIARS